jgi:prepilin-type N-terminal cleavage/methylation domain-containing protein
MRRTPGGFTLLELIAVIVMIAIAAAIVLPLLSMARERARRTACAQNLSAIRCAMDMYADVPANGCYPTTATSGDPFADKNAMSALNLLYKAYVQDPRVFSCPSKPVPPSTVCRIVTPGDPSPAPESSYGYDPGHGKLGEAGEPDDGPAAVMADKKGAGKNSDNHGANTGQNVALANGNVEFRYSVINLLGNDANGKALQDDDIFGLNSTIPRKLDGYIRQ